MRKIWIIIPEIIFILGIEVLLGFLSFTPKVEGEVIVSTIKKYLVEDHCANPGAPWYYYTFSYIDKNGKRINVTSNDVVWHFKNCPINCQAELLYQGKYIKKDLPSGWIWLFAPNLILIVYLITIIIFTADNCCKNINWYSPDSFFEKFQYYLYEKTYITDNFINRFNQFWGY